MARVQLQDEGGHTAPSASPTGGDHLNLTMCDFQHSKKTLGSGLLKPRISWRHTLHSATYKMMT